MTWVPLSPLPIFFAPGKLFFSRMSNLLNIAPDYQITRTAHGVWRRYLFASGALYSEFTSHTSFNGWPLVQIARGRSPETGKAVTARGVIAIGQKAVGLLAVGQMAWGVIAIGQIAVGVIAVGQIAAGVVFGLGQITMGIVAIGQCAVGLVGFSQQGPIPYPLDSLKKLFH